MESLIKSIKKEVPPATGDQILSITEFQIVCFEAAKLVERTNLNHHKEPTILKHPQMAHSFLYNIRKNPGE